MTEIVSGGLYNVVPFGPLLRRWAQCCLHPPRSVILFFSGAWRESQCLLATFFAILLLITLLLITATVLAFTLPTAISLVVKPGLQVVMIVKHEQK